MFDGIDRAQDLDELCKVFFSDKTDPPLPDSPYVLATLRSDQSIGLKSVLPQVSLRSLAESLFLHFVYTPPCRDKAHLLHM